MGRSLAKRASKWRPQLILLSDAARARETLSVAAAAMPELAAVPAVEVAALYDTAHGSGFPQARPARGSAPHSSGPGERIGRHAPASARVGVQQGATRAALAAALAAHKEATTVLCIGHNDGWETAASEVSGKALQLGTADAALLVGAAPDWSSALAPEGMRLRRLLGPGRRRRRSGGGSKPAAEGAAAVETEEPAQAQATTAPPPGSDVADAVVAEAAATAAWVEAKRVAAAAAKGARRAA